MTSTVTDLIRLITDMGYPITTAAEIYLPNKKASTETAISN